MAEDVNEDEPPQRDQLLEEASLWFARMRGPDAGRYRPQFEAWLALGAAHLGAYNRAGEVFALGKFLSASAEVRSDDARSTPARGRRGLLVAAAAVAAVALAVWFGDTRLPNQGSDPVTAARAPEGGAPGSQILSTKANEQRTFALADGSSLRLAPASSVAVLFDTAHRDLRLTRGSARFDVAHEGRPFVVHAGDVTDAGPSEGLDRGTVGLMMAGQVVAA